MKSKERAEFGDFQTPPELAVTVCKTARAVLPAATTVIDPTCGIGNLLSAASKEFGNAVRLIGVEISQEYLTQARARLSSHPIENTLLLGADFFDFNWKKLIAEASAPILILGNPPWITNAGLGVIDGKNLPRKANLLNLSGLDALTGKSNFDISEWMLIHLLQATIEREAAFALLVKVAVARKVLAYAWSRNIPLGSLGIFGIDAKLHFGASVDACLFVGKTDSAGEQECPVYQTPEANAPSGRIGWENGTLVADIGRRRETRIYSATPKDAPDWRSGVKHDCAKVLELRPSDGVLVNGFGEPVDVEEGFLYPFQKSSDVAGRRGDGGKRLIITQQSVGQATAALEFAAPRLWRYLHQYADLLDLRKSSIYRGKPRFSVFGVGDYTFLPWKVAISGLYKKLEFVIQGPVEGRPTVFDDTVYFLSYETEDEARGAHEMLCSATAKDFYEALIFWDAKRPITAAILRQLSLQRLGGERGERRGNRRGRARQRQIGLFSA